MKKESILKPLGRIGLYYLIYILLIALFTLLIKNEVIIYSFVMPIIDIIMIIFLGYILRKKLKDSLKNFKSNWKTNLKIIFKYWLIGLCLMMASNLIINLVILHGIAPNEETNRSILDLYPIYAIISMCFLAPIQEELLYRMNFKDALKKKNVFILTTAILFGAMHVIFTLNNPLNILYLIPYSALGFAFSTIYYKTDSIVSSILAHILHNSLSILIITLGI